jgi:hypothetical protein
VDKGANVAPLLTITHRKITKGLQEKVAGKYWKMAKRVSQVKDNDFGIV